MTPEKKMNREGYKKKLQELNQITPIKETPEGQKFNIGDKVKITNPVNWYSHNDGTVYEIQYSYWQKYNSISSNEENKKLYSLINLTDGGKSSWYDELELELAP